MVSFGSGKKHIIVSLSSMLAILGPAASSAAPTGTDTSTDAKAANSSTDGDIFSTQKWSIIPAGQATDSPKPVRRTENSGTIWRPDNSVRKNDNSSFISPAPSQSRRKPEASRDTAAEAAPLKLYGRIEELCTSAGAKIPLKMQAMTPIRDSSLDLKIAARTSTTRLDAKTSFFATGQKQQAHQAETPLHQAEAEQTPAPEPSFPIDYSGTWSGEMTVYLADFDRRDFDFDRAEAEQQQRLVTQGRKGSCSVTFFQGPYNDVQMRPTQITFSAPVGQAVQEMSQGNSALAALAGLVGVANNPMLANTTVPEFAIPLGNMSTAQGVTGNQLSSELMKNTLKAIAKGVLEQQVVTRDTDRNKAGGIKISFAENDLRFTRVSDTRLSLQAAAVSYDQEGNYLNKVVLTGMLDKGAPAADSSPSQLGIFGNPGQAGGSTSPFGDSDGSASPFGGSNQSGAANPFGNMFGGAGAGAGGGANPLGGLFGGAGAGGGANPLGGLFGGSGAGAGGAAPAQNMVDQMQQVQKMLKEMDSQ